MNERTNVKRIASQYISDNGYDCLIEASGECSCRDEYLFYCLDIGFCQFNCADCVPGYRSLDGYSFKNKDTRDKHNLYSFEIFYDNYTKYAEDVESAYQAFIDHHDCNIIGVFSIDDCLLDIIEESDWISQYKEVIDSDHEDDDYRIMAPAVYDNALSRYVIKPFDIDKQDACK